MLRPVTASRGGLALLLLLLTVAVFAQVGGHDFVDYDDYRYVVENPILPLGLSREAFARIWREPYHDNWIPLTSLSFQVSHALHGLRPGGYLLGNLALHAAATLVLFVALARMTGAALRSAFVAAVFAVHPLHVESVAWVSERKDALSGLFFMLTLLAYARLAERPTSLARQATVAICFALGLLAKPMLVTLPFVLLLLDFWPLRRLAEPGSAHLLSWERLRPRLLEKLPLLGLSAVSAAITYLVQQGAGAMVFAEELSPGERVANALASFAVYPARILWPTGLAPFYPFHRPSPALVASGALVLVVFSAAALRLAKRAPYLLVGWFWFAGMLVPVIGLVQVGLQARADRYMYLPLIGLSIAAAWGVPDALSRWPAARRLLPAAAGAAIACLAAVAWLQVSLWRDTVSLFEHTLSVTRDNFIAHHALATTYTRVGRFPDARAQFEETVRLKPRWAAPHFEFAALLDRLGEPEAAIAQYQEGLRQQPEHPAAQGNLGLLLAHAGRPAEAVPHLEQAVALRGPDPDQQRTWAQIAFTLGFAMLQTGRAADAEPWLRKALAGGVDSAELHQALAMTALAAGREAEAISHSRAALERNPDLISAANNLAWTLATSSDASLRDPAEAVRLAEGVVRQTEGKNPGFLDTLAVSYQAAGRWSDAHRTAQKAAELAESQGDQELARAIRSRAAGQRRPRSRRRATPSRSPRSPRPRDLPAAPPSSWRSARPPRDPASPSTSL
jgi:tetratricopeptide (TPR) repeat protein